MNNQNNVALINEKLNVVEYEEEKIKSLIYTIRGKQVMLDSDVARLYHYETKYINLAVRRNKERFPENFCFQLTEEELEDNWLQFATASKADNKFRNKKYLPYVFTEQGIAMLSGLLKNDIAVKVSINIMNAFVEMRNFLIANGQVFQRIYTLEYKQKENEKNFEKVFNMLQHEENIKQKIFFEGQIWDSYSLIIDLIKKAEHKITIIDNYIDDSILKMLAKKNENVEATIITSDKSNISNLDVHKFNKEYPILKLSKSNKFHDRFIIIDNKGLYHLCTIIQHITNLGIKADLVTNGTMLNESMVKRLEQAGLRRIRISIDELGNTSSIRSNESPNDLWRKAKMVRDTSNIEVCIHTVCSPANVKELFSVYKKVLEVGAARWRVFDLGYQGGVVNAGFDFSTYYSDLINSTGMILKHYLSNNLKEVLDIEINNIFRTMLLGMKYDEGKKPDIQEALNHRLLSSPCDYVADHQLSIRSNGKATLCQYFHNTIFDFKKYDFDVYATIGNQENVIENELTMGQLEYCKECKYCLVCNSGCRSRVQYLTGDIKDADPVACYLFPKIVNELIPMLPEETQKVYKSFINPKGNEPKYLSDDLKKILESKGG